MHSTRRRLQRGFTLIELAIIIAVLAILGSVGAVKLASMNQEARNSAALSDLANVRSALAMATAKNTTGTIGVNELNAYLEPNAGALSGNTFNWNSYTVYVQVATNSIVSIQGLENAAQHVTAGTIPSNP